MVTRTIIDKFNERVRAHPLKVALRHRVAGGWEDITWEGYGGEVERVGRGLMALGLEPGDRMGLLASNRPEWFFADLGCMSVRGTTAPIYVTSSAEQVAYVLGHSRARVAIVEDDDQLDKLRALRARLQALEAVVVMEGGRDVPGDLRVLTWVELIAAGESIAPGAFAARRADVEPDDVATFVYTSGTTGDPKAVMLTHANIWWTCEALERHIRLEDPLNCRALSYLPLSHIAERMVSHLLQILYGSQTWFASSIETLRDDLRDCRPTYFFGVPRVWEKFYGAVQARLSERPSTPRDRAELALLRRALVVGGRVVEAEQDAVARGLTMRDARLSRALRAQHALLDRLVLAKARARAGLGECTRAFSAAAPLRAELVWFFHSLGLKIAEGYGQSETNGPTTWNPHHAIKIGTVGTALPGLELTLADDGEILVRGGNVTPGYYEDEPATRALFATEGWMHTGDIGKLDEHGYLVVTDRKKDLIITSGGKNVAPQELENRLVADEIVSQAVVIGDERPYLTALITLDANAAEEWARAQGIDSSVADVAGHEMTLRHLQRAVDDVNATVSRAEAIKRFRVLQRDFTQQEEEITPTFKVRRRLIVERYGAVIEDMYRRDAPDAAPARPEVTSPPPSRPE
jgi:long-chain acyl-CoA synthetase